MNLKCIGGPCDGLWVGVDREYQQRYGDIIKVSERLAKLAPISEQPAMILSHHYVIDCLKYCIKNKVEELWFLRYDKLNTWEAIQFQFGK